MPTSDTGGKTAKGGGECLQKSYWGYCQKYAEEVAVDAKAQGGVSGVVNGAVSALKTDLGAMQK
jgi:hypothetical protein